MMFTDCPVCHRQFHIYAAQLSAAGGEVKCGYCGQQFNALQRLHDKPQPPVSITEQPPVGDAEPQFFIPNTPAPVPGPDTGPGDPAVDPSSDQASVIPVQETAGPYDRIEQQQGLSADTGAASDNFSAFEFSEDMLEEPEHRSGLVSRLLWGIGIVLLFIVAAVQVFWFNRDEVMSRYPETMPWYRQVCDALECDFIRHRDLSRIVLVNRDVRDHPRYRDALLVNATMSNQSHTLQPFPIVQLNLYATDGELIAYRQFSPNEYMDNSINIERGMRPDMPVHFVLEVLGAVEGAVSFEFEFL